MENNIPILLLLFLMWDIICLKEKRIDEVKIMYISVKEAAEKWNISDRRVRVLSVSYTHLDVYKRQMLYL